MDVDAFMDEVEVLPDIAAQRTKVMTVTCGTDREAIVQLASSRRFVAWLRQNKDALIALGLYAERALP